MSPPYDWLLFTTVCSFLLMGLFAVYVWITKKRYTRDKFAFSGFFALTGLALFYFTHLFAQNTIFLSLLSALLKPFGIAVAGSSSQGSAIEAVLFLLVLGLLSFVFITIHKTWDGAKSIAQHEQEENNEPHAIFHDIKLFISLDRENRAKLKPYIAPSFADSQYLSKPETLIWHVRAKQLWQLKNNSYEFPDENYDQAHKWWVGRRKDNGNMAILACPHALPDSQALGKLLNEAKSIASHKGIDNKIDFIVAHKHCSEPPSNCDSSFRFISERELMADLIDFSDYFEDIKNRVETQTLVDSEFTLLDTYVDAGYKLEKDGETQSDTLETFISNWLNSTTNKQLALLGEYGQGKSTTSLMFCYHQIARLKENNDDRIPILIELRGKTLRTMSTEEILGSWAIKYHIDVRSLLLLHMAGKLLLIFEGFDEIDISGDTEGRVKHFASLWRLNYENAKILITGRQNFFIGTEEEHRSLGSKEETKTIFLSPFNLKQVEHGLRAIKPDIRAQILALAEKDDVFKDVAARPSLLYMIANIWESNELSKREQINSAITIDLFIRQSLKRQQDKHDERPFMALNSSERHYFMLGIAAHMAAKKLPNQISSIDLHNTIELLIRHIPKAVSQNITATTGEVDLPLNDPKRFDWTNQREKVLERIKTDVRSCGLLVNDPVKADHFKFAHKSYMELLQAQVLFKKLVSDEKTENTVGNSISNTCALTLFDIYDSEEALIFFSELFLESQETEENEVAPFKKLHELLLTGRKLRSNSLFDIGQKLLLKTVTTISISVIKPLIRLPFMSESNVIRPGFKLVTIILTWILCIIVIELYVLPELIKDLIAVPTIFVFVLPLYMHMATRLITYSNPRNRNGVVISSIGMILIYMTLPFSRSETNFELHLSFGYSFLVLSFVTLFCMLTAMAVALVGEPRGRILRVNMHLVWIMAKLGRNQIQVEDILGSTMYKYIKLTDERITRFR